MECYFNVAGPCIPGEHYMLPALDRLPQVRRLVSRRQYFVIHAPRQTGKTTAVKALVREINAKGDRWRRCRMRQTPKRPVLQSAI